MHMPFYIARSKKIPSCAKHTQRRRISGVAGGMGLALLLSGTISTSLQAGSAPDANALVRRMIATYRKAQTIQETTEATVVLPGGGSYIQTGSMKWKRPNLIYLQSRDPQQGTVSVHATGKLVTIYSAKQNIFTNRNSSDNLRETMQTINRASQDALNIQMSQILNPISFLLSNGMPSEARSFRYAGETNLNGKRAHKVIGQADPAWLRGMAPTMTIVPVKRDVTLWIDARSNLLLKAAGHFTWKVTAANGARLQKSLMSGLLFEEVHRNTVLNAAIDNAAFNFDPPKGAKRIYQDRSY